MKVNFLNLTKIPSRIFVDYTLTDFIVKMINEKRITTAQIADLSNLEPNYINKLRIGQIKKTVTR